jgi:PAS domain S-box-containing protein
MDDLLGVVSAIACGCTDAIGDESRLRAAITGPLAAALGADCSFALAGETVLAPSSSTVDVELEHHGVAIGTLRLTRADPLGRDERVLAGLVADHAAVAWTKHAHLDPPQRTDKELAAAEVHARLAAIVDSTDDAIISKTLDAIVTSWNHGAEKLFGYTFDEVRGKSIMMLIPPGREHEELALLAHLRRGEVSHFDSIRRCKDGREVEVSVTSSPIYDAAGHLIGASKVARDITTRRVAELALSRAVISAQAANRELEAFSYSVAHDLRAPLRAVNGFSQILLEDYGSKLDAAGRGLIDDIQGGARTMGTLIDALLSLARLTRCELQREPTDLSAMSHSAVATLAASQPERCVHVTVANPLVVSADPRLTRVIIDNLVGNAWKFTNNVRQAKIEVGETERDRVRVFYVCDNGAGFDMAYAANLFAPFQRLHAVREFPGTGIGLATAQRIVHRHGGRIWAESAVNAGATFYFTLDASQEARA